MKKRKGGKRLNKRIAKEIRAYSKDNPKVTQQEIADEYGVTRESINRIINNKAYKDGSNV